MSDFLESMNLFFKKEASYISDQLYSIKEDYDYDRVKKLEEDFKFLGRYNFKEDDSSDTISYLLFSEGLISFFETKTFSPTFL